MNYIVFDLEFNQGYNFAKGTKSLINPKCPFEIIQIGAIKLDEHFETIGTLDVIVKPEIYTTLNPFVKELTGITMDELNTGKSFKEMYKDFSDFIKTDRSVLCVWGIADIKELIRNIEFYELEVLPSPTEYIDIQSFTSSSLNCKKGINIGLGNAAKLLEIPIESQFHNAFNDAFYTTEVFKKIYNKEIIPSIYTPTKATGLNRLGAQNYKIDLHSLTNQFEKMFKRKMSMDEKSIIKLAYVMGKTNQFQVKIDLEEKQKK